MSVLLKTSVRNSILINVASFFEASHRFPNIYGSRNFMSKANKAKKEAILAKDPKDRTLEVNGVTYWPVYK